MSGKSAGVPGDNPGTPTDALGTILGEFEGTPKTEVTFDELLEVAAGAGMTERRGHRLRVYGIVLVVLGVVVSYAWIFTGMLSSDQVRRVPGYESASTPTSRGTLDDLAAPSSALSPQQEVALSELSDAAWVSKVAQRTGITVVAGMFCPSDDGRVTNTLIAASALPSATMARAAGGLSAS